MFECAGEWVAALWPDRVNFLTERPEKAEFLNPHCTPLGVLMRLSRNRRAFTLTELLVVIGVIALLIGILLPSLARAREASRRAACLSNLRSLTQALHMYAQANKDRLPSLQPKDPPPPAIGFPWGYMPAANQVLVNFNDTFVKSPATFHCPSNISGAPSKIVTSEWDYENSARGSYEFFSVWFPEAQPCRISKMKGRAPLVWDNDGGGEHDAFNQLIKGKVPPLRNHPKGGNVGFADGHGEWQTEKDWDLKSWPHPAAEFYPGTLPGYP
jgi:prepilin-type N-terminal cleavage/methylation domain-containing protein/prepilin-type processing-associated H-X9-DG protein